MSISGISSVGSVHSQIQTNQVSAAALRAASSDGDGRTGAAALNDGDAAAQQAARGAAGGRVDIKA
jgi:hypothetical protein